MQWTFGLSIFPKSLQSSMYSIDISDFFFLYIAVNHLSRSLNQNWVFLSLNQKLNEVFNMNTWKCFRSSNHKSSWYKYNGFYLKLQLQETFRISSALNISQEGNHRQTNFSSLELLIWHCWGTIFQRNN